MIANLSMFRIAALITFIFLFFMSDATAQVLNFPSGLSVQPPERLDLTYQVLPEFDEQEKVLAGWDGDKLQYVLTVSKLPPGYLDAKSYLTAFAADIRKTWKVLEIGKQGSYQSEGGMAASAIVLTRPTTNGGVKAIIVVHHLTDGKQAFVATATAIPPTQAETVFEGSVAILGTAALATDAPMVKAQSNESPLIGSWVIEEKLPDGKIVLAKLELKSDLSFSTVLSVGQQTAFAATGFWSVRKDTLHWTYFDSKPALPEDKKEDEDQIVSVGPDVVVLKSFLSGKLRTMKRVTGS